MKIPLVRPRPPATLARDRRTAVARGEWDFQQLRSGEYAF